MPTQFVVAMATLGFVLERLRVSMGRVGWLACFESSVVARSPGQSPY